ncbi:TorD/DmsD family molecular chaperone [Halobiforma nitratireducens]|uniref:Cytoplasmic chaperone TorD family protein n=1 Tax=Halobiforma nitratireducens JCM 10879 TaxID=1227454 RepID=M0LE23_9EURY|nr:molecular chaperone TorD family protein [Halobiforma nitratireducens]EMA31363.1 hypothetical protein C446_15388 [Halobiforma nitratireducens JCM 10879]
MSKAAYGSDGGRDRATLAGGYAVLADCWRQPTERLLEEVATGTLGEIDPSVRDADLESLRVEHARLFVGPDRPRCPPYETVYRGSEVPGAGPTARAIEKWYRTYDFDLESVGCNLPDHVATELEFAAYLLEHEDVAICEEFLDEHLRQWLDGFLADVRQETREPYYEALSELTGAAVDR